MRSIRLNLTVNGDAQDVLFPPYKTLLEVLREELGLTGTKHGCELGECGACAVLIDGEPQMSCLMLAVSYQECEITTIEGVADGSELDPLQRGFCVEGGAQCGYCTPGMILTAKSLLARNPNPTEQEINEALSGNLCRCTGYQQIVEAIEEGARRLCEEQEG